jgi:hypothetical protein
VGGNAAKNAAQFEKLKATLAQQEISSAEVVGSALKKGDSMHRAGSFVTKDIATKGRFFSIKGNDGLTHNLTQMKGEVNGKKGIFEWIVNAEGKLTHQRFIPGGKITGLPNQKVT